MLNFLGGSGNIKQKISICRQPDGGQFRNSVVKNVYTCMSLGSLFIFGVQWKTTLHSCISRFSGLNTFHLDCSLNVVECDKKAPYVTPFQFTGFISSSVLLALPNRQTLRFSSSFVLNFTNAKFVQEYNAALVQISLMIDDDNCRRLSDYGHRRRCRKD